MNEERPGKSDERDEARPQPKKTGIKPKNRTGKKAEGEAGRETRGKAPTNTHRRKNQRAPSKPPQPR